MKRGIFLIWIVISITNYANAEKRERFDVKGTHTVGSAGPLTNTFGCQLALQDAYQKAQIFCMENGFTRYSNQGLYHGSCGQGAVKMWLKTKTITLHFFCE